MTSMLPIEGGLRHAKNVRIFRDIVNDYILPATASEAATDSGARAQEVLRQELETSRSSQGEPGVFVDPTDRPRR
jgi:hypothetical protein